MRGKRIYFFATKQDLELIIRLIESQKSILYVKGGLFDSPKVVMYESFLEFEDFGINKIGKATNGDMMFFIMPKNSEIVVRTVPQENGGTKYGIDAWKNIGAVNFIPSGFYDENTLIAGQFTYSHDDQNGLDLFNFIKKTIQKNSKQVGYARVCPDAMEFMKNGGRMVTMGIDSPSGYDLRFPDK
jgi:hypothetical protein